MSVKLGSSKFPIEFLERTPRAQQNWRGNGSSRESGKKTETAYICSNPEDGPLEDYILHFGGRTYEEVITPKLKKKAK
ncbi:unnamed protein product [Hymenolepis diminuta]|uniref:Uncharacterized protein n=1 Tax=Hymenolepis diminuta TaxID=6216 RepID=A0A0R3SZN9_HYMDI|nr:unnamed protein product [Hymenolepis diminuta]